MKGSDYLQQIKHHLRTGYLLSDEKIDTLLPQFLETLRKLMKSVDDLPSDASAESISRAGHALKGALLNLGLHSLAEKAFAIEQCGKSGKSAPDHESIIIELKEEIEKIR